VNWPVANRISEKLINTIMVADEVATSGLISSTPTFANIAVSAANTAESSARFSKTTGFRGSLGGLRTIRHCEFGTALGRP